MQHDTSGAEDQARRERIAKQIGLDKIAQDVEHKEAGGRGLGGADGAGGVGGVGNNAPVGAGEHEKGPFRSQV